MCSGNFLALFNWLFRYSTEHDGRGCYQIIRDVPAYCWKIGIKWMYFLTFLLFGFTYYNVERIPHEEHAAAVVRVFVAIAIAFFVALIHVASVKLYRCLILNIHRRPWTFGFDVAIFFLPALLTSVVNGNGYYSWFLVSYGIGNICQLKYAILDQPHDLERSRRLLEIIGAITLQILTAFVSSTVSAISSSTGSAIGSCVGSQSSLQIWMPVISNLIGLLIGVIAILPLLEDLWRDIYEDFQMYRLIPQGDEPRDARQPPPDLEAQQNVDVESDIVSGSDNRRVSGGPSSSFGHLNPGGPNSGSSEDLQSSPKDASLKNSSQKESALEARNHNKSQLQSGYWVDFTDLVTSYLSHDMEASDAREGVSGDYHSKLEHTEQVCKPIQAFSATLNNCCSPTSATSCLERVGISQFKTPGSSTASSFSEGGGEHVLYRGVNLDFDVPEGELGIQIGHLGSKKHLVYAKDEGNFVHVASRSMISASVEPIDEAVSRHSSFRNGGSSIPYVDLKQLFTGVLPSMTRQKHLACAKEEKADMIFESKRAQHGQNFNLSLNALSHHCICAQGSASNNKQSCFGEEEVEQTKPKSIPKVNPESLHSTSDFKYLVNDDPDRCILEGISQHPCSNQSVVLGKRFGMSQPACSNDIRKSVVTSHCSSCINTLNHTGVHQTGMEGIMFRVLSQPNDEGRPPDGVLV